MQLRKRKAENNHLPTTVAPARRGVQSHYYYTLKNYEVDNLKELFASIKKAKYFEFPYRIPYKGFLKKINNPIIAKLNEDSQKAQKSDHEYFKPFTYNDVEPNDQTITDRIIMFSYALWLMQQATDEPEVVYKVLQILAPIKVNEDKTLEIMDYYFADIFQTETDYFALFKDILKRHGAFIVSQIEAQEQAQLVWTQQMIASQDMLNLKVSFPPDITVKIYDGRNFFLFEDGTVRPPNYMDKAALIPLIRRIFLINIVVPVLVPFLSHYTKPECALIIYKLLKKMIRFSIDEKTQRLNIDGEEDDNLTQIKQAVAHFEGEIIALLKEKKAHHQAAIASLVTKKVGGPDSIDMLLLCGEKDCVPIPNSDQLLSFLSQEIYTKTNFLKIVFKTLQIINPKACFLPEIYMKFNKDDKGEYYSEFFKKNLSLAKYKSEQIDTCAARVLQPGRRKVAQGVRGLSYGRQERPLIAIPFSFIFDGSEDGHANMLIINPNKRECEHFEPHGEAFLDVRRIDLNKEIERTVMKLSEQLFPGYTYIPRSEATNFQSMLNRKFAGSLHGGTCQVWSIWYAYLRLSHPEFDREEILKRSYDLLAQNDFAELERFIIKFMEQLNAIAGVYEVGKKFFNANNLKL